MPEAVVAAVAAVVEEVAGANPAVTVAAIGTNLLAATADMVETLVATVEATVEVAADMVETLAATVAAVVDMVETLARMVSGHNTQPFA